MKLFWSADFVFIVFCIFSFFRQPACWVLTCSGSLPHIYKLLNDFVVIVLWLIKFSLSLCLLRIRFQFVWHCLPRNLSYCYLLYMFVTVTSSKGIISINFHPSQQSVMELKVKRFHCQYRYVMLWSWRLTFWPWTDVVIFPSHVLPPAHQLWASYDRLFLNYVFQNLTVIGKHVSYRGRCALSRDLFVWVNINHIFKNLWPLLVETAINQMQVRRLLG